MVKTPSRPPAARRFKRPAQTGSKKPADNAKAIFPTGGTGVSIYQQLATLFRSHISTHRWKLGDQIPTIGELAKEYGIARETVRQALDLLAGEKLIERFRAKGTFVTHHPEEQMWCEVETDWAGLLRTRRGVTIETLVQKSNQQPHLAPDFSGKLAKHYRYFRRRHWRNDEPFLLSEMYFDESVFKRVPKSSLADKPGLQFLAEIPGLHLADFRQMLTLGSADMMIAEKLRINLNAPVAFMRRYAFDKNNVLVFTGESIYRGDVFFINMKLKPN